MEFALSEELTLVRDMARDFADAVQQFGADAKAPALGRNDDAVHQQLIILGRALKQAEKRAAPDRADQPVMLFQIMKPAAHKPAAVIVKAGEAQQLAVRTEGGDGFGELQGLGEIADSACVPAQDRAEFPVERVEIEFRSFAAQLHR